jgi:hypothetical protein
MKNGLIVDIYGTKRWYKNDLPHRTDGPAIIHSDGTEMWYFEGKLHRTDGPAIIEFDGYKEWWINHKCLTHNEWLIILGHKKEPS